MAHVPLSKDEVQERINVIFTAAVGLHDIMPEGVTFEVVIPTKQELILPNQQPEVKTLLITRLYKLVKVSGQGT